MVLDDVVFKSIVCGIRFQHDAANAVVIHIISFYECGAAFMNDYAELAIVLDGVVY